MADDGSIIEWEADKAAEAVRNGHAKGPCRSGACTTIFSFDTGIVSGGNDGKVILWTHQLAPTFVYDLKGAHIELFDVLPVTGMCHGGTSTSESTDDQTKSGVGKVEIQDPKPQAGEESPAEQSEEKAPETSGGMGKNEEKVEVN